MNSTMLVLENVVRILMQKVNHLKNMVANTSSGTVLLKDRQGRHPCTIFIVMIIFVVPS